MEEEKKEDINSKKIINNSLEKQSQEIIKEEPEAKLTNKKTTFIYLGIIVVIFIGLFMYMVNVDGIDNIINLLHKVDYRWVFGGIVCLIIYWICEAYTLHLPLKKMYSNQTITNSIKVSMIGQLFNNLTPFASGGQPMQAYELTKSGKRVSDSLSAMAMKFIITQTALVICSVVVMVFQLEFFMNLMKDFIWVAILGFGINILAIIVVILMGVKKKIITSITTPCIKFFAKIHIIKHPEKTIEKLDESINNFGKQFKFMRQEKKMVLRMFIISVIQSFAYYTITYMVYKAFGNSGISFWQIIPAQAFLLLIMTFIPTPGSGLGAEGGFLILFNSIFKEGTINMSILFWRLYTFYLPIIVGALFLIPTRKRKKGEVPKNPS